MPRDIERITKIAVVGSGISGMAAAWLLAPHAQITLFESAERLGGHTNTVSLKLDSGEIAVDTGFIVFNESTYPNLKALFAHLGVETYATNMSFAASLRGGAMEYSGESLPALFAQKGNLVSARFWSMLYDLQRFYRHAPRQAAGSADRLITLGKFLKQHKYSDAFVQDHLLPLAAAIWSSAPGDILDYPVESFVRFHENHGLLKFVGRPLWRTVRGGSRSYIEKITAAYAHDIELSSDIACIERNPAGIDIVDRKGSRRSFDHVVIATHADQALDLLVSPTGRERKVLSAFRYSANRAWLHSDPALMPQRRNVWASWNFIDAPESAPARSLTVTYWMNKLQDLGAASDLFVTLNPGAAPRDDLVHRVEDYSHPVIDSAAIGAQKELWSLQGAENAWFCGAYFGAGFHEDGLQAGLAAAENLALCIGLPGVRRPWRVADESGRIHVSPARMRAAEGAV